MTKRIELLVTDEQLAAIDKAAASVHRSRRQWLLLYGAQAVADFANSWQEQQKRPEAAPTS